MLITSLGLCPPTPTPSLDLQRSASLYIVLRMNVEAERIQSLRVATWEDQLQVIVMLFNISSLMQIADPL